MATRFSILAWRLPRTEEPGGLQSMMLQKVRHDLATELPRSREARVTGGTVPGMARSSCGRRTAGGDSRGEWGF